MCAITERDNDRRLVAAVTNIMGKRVEPQTIRAIVQTYFTTRDRQLDPDAFDERMNQYLRHLEFLLLYKPEETIQLGAIHRLQFVALENMIPAIEERTGVCN